MYLFSKKLLISSAIGFLLLISIATLLILLLQNRNLDDVKSTVRPTFTSSNLMGNYRKAAVATHSADCAEIARDLLEKNGSAVDAAIGALLCEGVGSFHSMGLGGGFLMTVWDAEKQEAVFLNARESAPANASRDMFNGDQLAALYGAKAIAVPGELAGYWEAHQRYGKLAWSDLFQPTIELCDKGSYVNPYIADTIHKKLSAILAEPSLAEILINPQTNSTWTTGDRIKRPKLKKTLQLIAEKGIDVFYNGSIGQAIVQEIQDLGGIMQMSDLQDYRVQWKKPVEIELKGRTVYTAALPGSGVILSFILNVAEDFLSNLTENIFWQRIVETFKWAYARRTELGDDSVGDIDIKNLISKLTSKAYAEETREKIKDKWTSNDPLFYGAVADIKDDHGTAHVSIVAPDGSAVSVTSTINQVLGAMLRSRQTGIIFNDEMDDFSAPNITNGFDLPPSPSNFIAPGKRPLSSMSPTIIVNKEGDVEMVVGAAGGTKITTGIALTIILNLLTGFNVKEAVDAKRIHHQLVPMIVEAERNFTPSILDYLRSIDHKTTHYAGLGSAVNAISRIDVRNSGKTLRNLTANSDYRRFGAVAGF